MAPPNVPICSRSTDLGRPRRTDSPARSPSADDLQEEPMLFDDPSSSSPTIGDARPATEDPQLQAGRGQATSGPWLRSEAPPVEPRRPDAQPSPDPRLIETAGAPEPEALSATTIAS